MYTMETKRMIALIALASAMLMTLSAVAVTGSENDGASDVTVEYDSYSLKYKIDGSEAAIYGYGGTLPEDLVIPSTITVEGKTYSVTAVGPNNHVFKNVTTLKTVVMPDSVKTIGERVFAGCTGLTEVTIAYAGNDNGTIGPYAFNGCTGITKITIGDGITIIGNGAFESAGSSAKVTIPSSVTMIKDSAFQFFKGIVTFEDGSKIHTIEWGRSGVLPM